MNRCSRLLKTTLVWPVAKIPTFATICFVGGLINCPGQMALGDTTVGSTPTWGLLGIRVNFYHFLLVEGMVSEKGFAAILFNSLFLKKLLYK